MNVFAILNDYKRKESGVYVRTHAVLLTNWSKEPSIKTFSYGINGSETVPREDLKKFLESAIPAIVKGKIYDVYACEGYINKYSSALNDLKHRFRVVGMNDTPQAMQELVIENFKKLNEIASIDSQKCLEVIIKKTSMQR